jgi:hypothetical protein
MSALGGKLTLGARAANDPSNQEKRENDGQRQNQQNHNIDRSVIKAHLTTPPIPGSV